MEWEYKPITKEEIIKTKDYIKPHLEYDEITDFNDLVWEYEKYSRKFRVALQKYVEAVKERQNKSVEEEPEPEKEDTEEPDFELEEPPKKKGFVMKKSLED